MAKRTFVMLTKLTKLWTDDKRWLKNVRDSVGSKGYTLSSGEDDEGGTRELRCDELTFVREGSVKVYDFMGSEHEEERFYERDIVVYKVKATGEYCVMWYEDIESF